ncbi:DUF6344 domain-containing protein [Streptomyces albipurpureus]|uniref:DUF6344 domain-containing protein n=1 Tax=Streptomyces albipurpureus TaxID=2897419 RepID=A0ABT0UKU6_9ACTN|nr:DUF6344 domain-containing protein [Streptomyces sp. CWNU-1]MCM2388851.1 DUF6344 domain-containing protein [Streptomyces sp. CWNU-1]
MAAIKVRDLWTSFITAFFALLASIGLTSAASSAAAQPIAQTPELPALPQQERKGDGARAVVPAQSRRWRPAVRERSLPPTIKQRISAEAHGSSPSVRKLPILDADPIATAIAGARPGSAAGSSRARWLGRGSAAQPAVETGGAKSSTTDTRTTHSSASTGMDASPSAGAPAVEGDHSASGGPRDGALSEAPVAPVVQIVPVGLSVPHSPQGVPTEEHRCGDADDTDGALDQRGSLDQGQDGTAAGVDRHRALVPHGEGAGADVDFGVGVDGVDGVLDQSQGCAVGPDHGRVLDLDQYRALALDSDADDDYPGASQTLNAA